MAFNPAATPESGPIRVLKSRPAAVHNAVADDSMTAEPTPQNLAETSGPAPLSNN